MDPSRIRLEDDRFGLIGAAFRPGNHAVYAGRRGDDYVWSIGIIVGPDDDIQTVEIDDRGAKSSRMLTSGERFEGLDILAAPGAEAYIIAGTFTLMGMELGAGDQGSTHDFADILRAAADDHSWRLPLRVVGHPRDLQLSAQGRDILRETAATMERDGSATTSLAAARRLELSEQALDSIRRRISRTSLQAYRMHGRWYVVLDNLARSRTTPAAVEEAPEEAEEPPTAEAVAEPASVELETQPDMSGAPTEDDLAVFAEPEVAEPEVAEPEEPAAEATELLIEPGVEYIEEEAAEPVAAAETDTMEPETSEPQAEATAADDLVEPEIEVAAETVETPPEPVVEESVEAEARPEGTPEAESETTEEYRVAATTASPASQLEADTVAPEPDAIEQPVEASVEDLATTSIDGAEVEPLETATVEAEQPRDQESEMVAEEPAEAEVAAEGDEHEDAPPEAEATEESMVEPESIEAEPESAEVPVSEEAEPHTLEAEAAASIEEPVAAEDLSTIEATISEDAAPAVEEPIEAEAPGDESESSEQMPESAADLAALETTVDEAVAEESAASDAEPIVANEESEPIEHVMDEEPEAPEAPEMTETVQSEEALLFAEMAGQATTQTPSATELDADVAEQSDQLIAEHISDAAAAENGEVEADASAVADESETATEAAVEPSDEVIAEGIRTHAPAYADEVGRDELIESTPAPETEEQVEPEPDGEVEIVETAPVEADVERSTAEPEQNGGPSAASYFADARGSAEARQAVPSPTPEAASDLSTHLRGEVAFLRQQSREKDRQIGVWGDGAKWLQPFVDQIRSLEKQVERLGELQVQRENDRISDLISERDGLRQRLETLEAKISATQAASSAPSEPNRRSWFRRMMGSE